MDKISAVNKTGLVYQFIGTIILGYTLAFTSDDELRMLSATRWTFNQDLFDSLSTQRTDIRFGVLILLLGIFIAFFDNWLSKKLTDDFIFGLSSQLLALLAFITTSYFCTRYGYNVSISEIISGFFLITILAHLIFHKDKNRK